jgi:hypothetical protein
MYTKNSAAIVVIILSIIAIIALVAYSNKHHPSPAPANNTQSTNTNTNNSNTNTAANPPAVTDKSGLIQVAPPKPNDVVSSPLTITGKARGPWYFEAQFPIKIKDANGTVLGTTTAHAIGDWMTTDFVPFTATLTFSPSSTATGSLVLQKDNPSGLPQNDDSLVVPIRFNNQTLTVKTFFNNIIQNPNAFNCSAVFPVNRTIAFTQATARAALTELLKGPSTNEIIQGYQTLIPAGTTLNDITISNGTATADFSSNLNTAAGSCRVSEIRAQITQTLKQFPTITNVIISVNGDINVLQP